MRLTKASDYAFILLNHLNSMDSDKKTSVKEVSVTCNIPKRFLANIVHRLSKAGIILSVKGMDGGIRLLKRSDEITIKDVLEVLEGDIRFVDCQIHKGVCKTEEMCAVKNFWDSKLETFMAMLDNTTIKDLSEFSLKTSGNSGIEGLRDY